MKINISPVLSGKHGITNTDNLSSFWQSWIWHFDAGCIQCHFTFVTTAVRIRTISVHWL